MALSHKSNKLFPIYRFSVLGLKTMWPINHTHTIHHPSLTCGVNKCDCANLWFHFCMTRQNRGYYLVQIVLGRLLRMKSCRGRNGWLVVTWKVGHEWMWMCLLPQYGSRAKMCDVHSMMTSIGSNQLVPGLCTFPGTDRPSMDKWCSQFVLGELSVSRKDGRILLEVKDGV